MNDRELPSTLPLFLMGILLIVLGVLAIATPAVAGEWVVLVIGIMLLLAGAIQIATGLRSEGWSRRLPPLMLGVISLVCGLGLVSEPIIGMKAITWIMAAFFVIEGVWKIFASFNYRPAMGWLALLLSGILTLGLGYLIFRQWPLSGMTAIGILVGVDLLVTGISMVIVAQTMRRLKREVEGVVDEVTKKVEQTKSDLAESADAESTDAE
ncbi:MAG: HdeD family acid-resistance protein [Rubripirellula sp.]